MIKIIKDQEREIKLMQTIIKHGKHALTWSVVISTIAWSIGLAALLVPLAEVHSLQAGDLIKASQPAVYYYGSDGKRYVFPNEKTYKTWYSDFSGVITITDAELAAVPIGGNVTYRPGVKMVKITTDPKVYAVDAGGTLRWVQTEAIATSLYGANWNQMIEDVPDPFFVNYTVGAEITDAAQFDSAGATAGSTSINEDKGLGAAPTGGSLTVSLAPDTPPAGLAVENAARLPFTKVNLTNPGSTDVIVDQVIVRRMGLATDASFSSIEILNADTEVALNKFTKNLNSEHLAVFNDDFTVPANSTLGVFLAGNMASTNDARAGEVAVLALDSVVLKGGGTVSGTMPIAGNNFTINATLVIGTVTVAAGGNNPTATTQKVGEKDYIVSSIKVTAGATEDINVKKITFTNNGSAAPDDVENIELVDSNTSEVVATMAVPTSDDITFTLNKEIKKGKNKTFDLRLDIKSGSARTISYDIDKQADLVAVGKTYGYKILPTYPNTATPYFNAANTTIGDGSLRIESLPVTPTNIAEGLNGITLGKFKFVTKGEGMDITSIGWNFELATSAAATAIADITNVTIFDESGNAIAGPLDPTANTGGTDGTATTTDTISLPVGETTVTVKGDLNTDWSLNDTIQTGVHAGAITVKGQITGNTIAATPANTNTQSTKLTIKTASLTVSVSSVPAADTVVAGAQDLVVSNIVLDGTSSGDDVRITSLPISLTIGATAIPDYFAGWTIWDGANEIPVSSESTACFATSCSTAADDATITLTIASGKLSVTKGTIKTVKVTVDVSSAATSGSFQVGQKGGVSGIDSDGNTVSGSYANNSGTLNVGSTFTLTSAGKLTNSVSDDPEAALVVANTEVNVGEFSMLGEYENFEVGGFGIMYAPYPQSGGANLDMSGNHDEIASIAIYEGGTLIGSSVWSASSTNATITPSSVFTLDRNVGRTLTLKATLNKMGPGEVADPGARLAFGVSNIDATGKATGSTKTSINRTNLATYACQANCFSEFTIHKSRPTVTRLSFTTDNQITSSAAVVDMYQFKVSADSQGPIGLFKFTFGISTSTITINTSTLKLYEGDSQGAKTRLISIGTGDMVSQDYSAGTAYVIGTYFDKGDNNDATKDSGGSVLADCSCEWLHIPASVTKFYTLVATMKAGHDTTANNETIATVMAGDADYASTTPGSAKSKIGGGQGGVEGIDDKAENDFIWSDLFLSNSTAGSSTATNAPMWFNGYRVPGLDTTSSTQTVVTD
jgi:hypothetical protein